MKRRIISLFVYLSIVVAGAPAFADPKPAASAGPKVTKTVPHVGSLKLPGIGGSSSTHASSGSNGWKPPASLTGKTTKTTGDAVHGTTVTGTNGWKPPASLGSKSGKTTTSDDAGHDRDVKDGGKSKDADASKDKDKDKDKGKSGGSGSKDSGSKDSSKDAGTKDSGTKGVDAKDGTKKDDGKSKSDGLLANPKQLSSWAWNKGTAWLPQAKYWGGSFWGLIPAGIAANAYYDVDASSPGHTLLDNYGLKQSKCDSSGHQVELYGPDVSMVCASPNDTVPAGRYDIDMSTLSLKPTTAE
jgi:hypothetical protein